MPTDRCADDPVATRLIHQLYTDVGAFFRNTRRGTPLTCCVCTGPASTMSSLRGQCRAAHDTYGDSVADLVVPLAYEGGRCDARDHPLCHEMAPLRLARPSGADRDPF